MATSSKLVGMRPKASAKPSPLTPALKEFIDRAIVPLLVKKYLAENELENSDSDAAHSQRNTAAPKARR